MHPAHLLLPDGALRLPPKASGPARSQLTASNLKCSDFGVSSSPHLNRRAKDSGAGVS